MICQSLSSKCGIFADDIKIYDKSWNHDIVQMGIHNMIKWSSHCCYFILNKCYVLHSREKNVNYDYLMSIAEADYKIVVYWKKVLALLLILNCILTSICIIKQTN